MSGELPRLLACILPFCVVVGCVAGQTDGIPASSARSASGDKDRDAVLDIDDNCPYLWNPDQKDSRGDGIGDVCRVVELAKEELARRLGGNSAVLGIHVANIRAVVWADECLGLPRQGETCKTKRIAGYKVRFGVTAMDGKEYVCRTDLTNSVRFPAPRSGSSGQRTPARAGTREK